MATYNYTKSPVSVGTLLEEILAETGITITITNINYRSGTSSLDIFFASILSAPELSLLNAIVAAHGGVHPDTPAELPTAGVPEDYVIISDGAGVSMWVHKSTAVSGVTHSVLSGLSNDDHPQYPRTDGSRGFTSTVSGVYPIQDDDLTTKGYVDATITGSILTGDMACIQIRRTTPYYFTSSYVDLPLDTTDIESNSDVLEHNDTNTDRVDIKEDGYYKITYTVSMHPDTNSEFWMRVKVNDTTVVPGSVMFIEHSNDVGGISDDFIVYLYAGNFITLQGKSTYNNGHTDTDIVMTVIKLQGSQGPQGPAGAGSSLTVKDEGSNVANTPHTDLNFIGDGVSVSDAGSGVATVNIAGGSASVFGTEFAEFENNAISSTTTPDWALAGTLASNDLPAGKYRIGWYAEIRCNSTLQKVKFGMDTAVNGGDYITHGTPHIEPKDINNYYPVGGFVYRTLSAGDDLSAEMYWGRTGASATVYIKRRRIEIWRVS